MLLQSVGYEHDYSGLNDIPDEINVENDQAVENDNPVDISPTSQQVSDASQNLANYKSLIEQINTLGSGDTCGICDKSFEDTSSLKCHIILQHIGYANWCQLEPGITCFVVLQN